MATHLADTSALARLTDPDVLTVLGPMLAAGRVATCAVVDLEVLRATRSDEEHTVTWFDRQMYPRVACSDQAMERAVQVQGLLANGARHRGVPVTDLVIAAAAELAGLTVLHYDRDFDLIGEVTGQPMEWVVPRGTVP